MPLPKIKFSEQLRQWRGSRTQSRAAALLDVNISTYQNWEYGRNQPSQYAQSSVLGLLDRATEAPPAPMPELE
jgi:DNA-binding transcriptional regulator YiaG